MSRLTLPGVTELLDIDVEAGIATLALNRPKVLNALNHEQRTNLETALRALDADDAVRVVVLKGSGRAFCAGQDQKESASMDSHGAHRRILGYASLYRTMRRFSKPIIASIHGYATGGGLQLALLSDLRIASDDTKVGMTELNVGSAAIMGSAFLLATAGEAVMRRLVMMSEFVSAATARDMNLLHEVHAADALGARVSEIATRLAGWPPLGIALTKEWWRIMGDDAFEAAMKHAEEAHARNFAAGGLTAAANRFVGGARA
jgi:enoyl-CoA hydratase/carnithine racemase